MKHCGINNETEVCASYTGACILIESLIAQGVDTVFGYPGGAVLNIYDELYRQKDRIRHILVSHEQHAAHAADGYARSTGKVGVCIATSGPGATNLVTGIATAYMDSSPVVAITGNVTNELLGKDSFQEVDITGITMPVVKHNWIVKDINELAKIISEAFIIARCGRPGPVLIDIPKDVTAAKTDILSSLSNTTTAVSERAERLAMRTARETFNDTDIDTAVRLIKLAERPIIYAGGGVIISGADNELRELAERIGAPVALSLMGHGALSRSHPLWTGMLGMHGTVASNKAVQKADLLITLGARFSDRVTSRADKFAKNAKILHFDIDPAEINKNIRSSFYVSGDIKKILKLLLEKIPELHHPEWNNEIQKWKGHTPPSHIPGENRKTILHPRFIVEETAKLAGNNAIIVTDVGQHQMWTAQFFPFEAPRSFITSGGLGTMGFGLGAAFGAKIANPKKNVILFTGDGSFRMNCAELGTLAAYKIPVLIIVFNNGVLGMVRQWQKLFYEERYSETVLDRSPDLVKLAEAYGLCGMRARHSTEFIAALENAKIELSSGRACVIDAVIDSNEMVLPMVPGGKPIDEQIL
ncbi:MAG: biosynthetic-type acetolactate synthase large subunit [Spirochaetaceae bacterium]|jgi:acetolactate synthase-1/2/3 large subunit|nr:biosynthetic-type acetolactate synthase large subunit [Spirochaetaceae bacterium]